MTDEKPESLEHRFAGGSPEQTRLHLACTAALVAALIGVASWLGLERDDWRRRASRPEPTETLQNARLAAGRNRVAAALDVYRVLEGKYPDVLERLVDRGLLRSRDLYYATSRTPWTYVKNGGDVILSPPDSADAK